jgi:hypothetical protein
VTIGKVVNPPAILPRDPEKPQSGAGYRIETLTSFVPGKNDKGEDVLVKTEETIIHCEEGSFLWLLFGPIITGPEAEALAANPGALAVLMRIKRNFDPPRSFDREISREVSRL